MFDIGIFAPFGDDHQRNLAFCNDTAVRHIVLSVSNVEQEEGGVPAANHSKTWPRATATKASNSPA